MVAADNIVIHICQIQRIMFAVLNSVLLISAAAIFLKVIFDNTADGLLSRLATKTPYRFVANFSEHVVDFNGKQIKQL